MLEKYKLTPQVRSFIREQILEMLREEFSIDTTQYTCTVEWNRVPYKKWNWKTQCEETVMERTGGRDAVALLRHKKSNAQIIVRDIYFEEDGGIMQHLRPELY